VPAQSGARCQLRAGLGASKVACEEHGPERLEDHTQAGARLRDSVEPVSPLPASRGKRDSRILDVKKRGVAEGVLRKSSHKVQETPVLLRLAVPGRPAEQSAKGRLLAFSFRSLLGGRAFFGGRAILT